MYIKYTQWYTMILLVDFRVSRKERKVKRKKRKE